MRYPESKIRKAILHPEEEMREQALHYFSDARSQDDTVMPLVIQAVEKYGRDTAFAILRDAEHLVQTEATIDWLMEELRRDFNTRRIDDDIHTDLCVAKCRRFLSHEDDPEVELLLANALLGNFVTDAVELIWPLVDGIEEDELMPDQRDLRYRLVSTATIIGQSFPRLQEWRKAALRDNWGKFHVERKRLADAFRPDLPGPAWSVN